MKLQSIIFVLLVCFTALKMQVHAQDGDSKRLPTQKELKHLIHTNDSLLRELKKLFAQELREQQTIDHQPERIALVRQYLNIYMHFERTCGVVKYTPKDVTRILGKPDTTYQVSESPRIIIRQYGKVQKKYIRISNLRYKFYFENDVLSAVKRAE